MAGNYGGLPFEAANSRAGIRVGAAARSVMSFPALYHMARGGLIDLNEWARRAGLAIGGDPAHLRIDRFDRGGLLLPGHFGYNGTRQPETVLGPDVELRLHPDTIRQLGGRGGRGGGLDEDRLARKIAAALMDALHDRPLQVIMDGRRLDAQLGSARIANSRRR
jgi:hypothetical protein